MWTPWIKLEHTTPEKPEMLRAAKMLKKDHRVVFYHWVKLMMWADVNVGDDCVAVGATLAALSNIARLEGIAEAFAEPVERPDGTKGANWLEETPYGVRFNNWTRHNGKHAKARAQAAQRQARKRLCHAHSVTTNSICISDSCLSLFDDFWDKYPRKTGKTAAQRAWAKVVKHTDPKVIIAAAADYAASPAARDPKYVKYPATWLNAGCWEDDRADWQIERGDCNGQSRGGEKAGKPSWAAKQDRDTDWGSASA